MECPKCKGKGWLDNPRYYAHDAQYSWSHGIPTRKKCSNCKGSGYIIGNMTDIVDRLRCAANGVTISDREAKQMYEAIVKYK